MPDLADDPDRQIFRSRSTWQDLVQILVIEFGDGWQDCCRDLSVVLHPSAFQIRSRNGDQHLVGVTVASVALMRFGKVWERVRRLEAEGFGNG